MRSSSPPTLQLSEGVAHILWQLYIPHPSGTVESLRRLPLEFGSLAGKRLPTGSSDAW